MIRTLLFCLLLSAPAFAVTLEAPLPSPAQEQQAREIFTQLKCVVCEGQALGESDAPLAREMRVKIRSMVNEGQSEPEILAYFAKRYGDAILLEPPLTFATGLLWFAPLLFLVIGGLLIYRHSRAGGNLP